VKNTIKNPRDGCALHGALMTASAIRGVTPIAHSNSGCAMQNYLSRNIAARLCGLEVPGTNVLEKQVIFGGGSRLREQIKNTVKVLDGSLYIVLNSCESAMVGDDVQGMAKEAAERKEPVICARTAGFHGAAHHGYSRTMWDLIDGAASLGIPLGEARERRGRTVSVFGIAPGVNAHFRGDLLELRRIIRRLGAEANIFFGPGAGAAELADAPSAVLDVSFSKWGGFVCERMEEKYGTPKLEFDCVPVGFETTREMVLAIAERISPDDGAVDGFLRDERAEFEHFMELTDEYRPAIIGARAALVGAESVVAGVGKFLSEYLGATAAASVITDLPANRGTGAETDNVCRSADSEEIEDFLRRSNPDIILGSPLEAPIARELGVPLLEISPPAGPKLTLNKSYLGVPGAVSLTEDYISALTAGEAARNREMALEIRRRAGR
jgi:nitrogenase molybdenum-iron protein beta chain